MCSRWNWGLGSRLERAIDRLSRCTPEAGVVGEDLAMRTSSARHFLMMAGAGFDAQVVCDLSPGLKSRTGKLAYWVAGFSQIVKRVGQLETRINGDTYPLWVHTCGACSELWRRDFWNWRGGHRC